LSIVLPGLDESRDAQASEKHPADNEGRPSPRELADAANNVGQFQLFNKFCDALKAVRGAVDIAGERLALLIVKFVRGASDGCAEMLDLDRRACLLFLKDTLAALAKRLRQLRRLLGGLLAQGGEVLANDFRDVFDLAVAMA